MIDILGAIDDVLELFMELMHSPIFWKLVLWLGTFGLGVAVGVWL